MAVVEQLTFGTVVSLALGSSVVGSLVTQGITWFKEGRTSGREAAYLALRLATIFEKYGENAAEVLGDMDDYDNSSGSHGGFSGAVPVLGSLPDDKERWRDLPTSLSARVLGFDPYRRTVQSGIDNCFEVVGQEDGYHQVKLESIKLGCRALDIAAALRSAYKLPPLETDWHWPQYLRGQLEKKPVKPPV
jgi:hypothetical protein